MLFNCDAKLCVVLRILYVFWTVILGVALVGWFLGALFKYAYHGYVLGAAVAILVMFCLCLGALSDR